jgi:two-component system sensor histidine kinase YesM
VDFDSLPDQYTGIDKSLTWNLTPEGMPRGLGKISSNFNGIYAGVCVNLSHVMQSVSGMGAESGFYVLLIDSHGAPLVENPDFPLPALWEANQNGALWSSPKGVIAGASNESFLIVARPTALEDVNFVMALDNHVVAKELSAFNIYLTLLLLLVVFLGFAASVIIHFNLNRPVRKAARQMQIIGGGDLSLQIDRFSSSELDIIAQSANRMIYEIVHLQDELHSNQLTLERDKLRYLQMQIKPHFFANALNSVYNFTFTGDIEAIRELTKHLFTYYRYMADSSRTLVTVQDEIDQINNLKTIYRLRQVDNLEFFVRADGESAANLIPPLLLLTLVENSIQHGYNKGTETLSVEINAVSENDSLSIGVRDNGKGFSDETLTWLQSGEFLSNARGGHIGLYNIVKRLQLVTSGRSVFIFGNRAEGGAFVEITMPKSGAPNPPEETAAESLVSGEAAV